MIVKSNDVFEVPDVDAPIVVEVVHTGVDVVDTCMVVCSRMFLCGIDFSHDSSVPIGRIETCGLNSSSVKGFLTHAIVDGCRCSLMSSLSQFFVLSMLLEV